MQSRMGMDMKEKPTLEQSLERLEEIVNLLGDSQVDLNRSLELFTEGVRLSEACREELLRARQVVEKHLAPAKGAPPEEPADD